MANNSKEQGKEGAANINCLSITRRLSAQMVIPGPLIFSSAVSDTPVCLDFFGYCNHQKYTFQRLGFRKPAVVTHHDGKMSRCGKPSLMAVIEQPNSSSSDDGGPYKLAEHMKMQWGNGVFLHHHSYSNK